PPPAAFWTLSLYQVAADGRLLRAANAIDRHSVGSGTDLRGRPDGGIDIWIGQADPGGSRTPNWLPAPAEGTFALILRAYLPGEDLLTRRYRPPPLEVLAPSSQPPPPRRRLNGM
ncbi:MAG TPA: DUF1214 domain-containing protein, partial [Caulobacteraceae bacterium]|nr:DUF1214 domain-containing protein [Caulobacteraceae bacterium]